MADQTTSSSPAPADVQATPRAVRVADAERRGGTRVPPPRNVSTGPSATAGHGIGAVVRQPPSLPPGIPAGLAGHIDTTGEGGGVPAEAEDRHAMFAPASQAMERLRNQARLLRNQLVTAVATAEQTITVIDNSVALFGAGPDATALLQSEGIDLERLGKFRDGIQGVLELVRR